MTRRKTGRERKVFHSTLLLHKKRKKRKKRATRIPHSTTMTTTTRAPFIVTADFDFETIDPSRNTFLWKEISEKLEKNARNECFPEEKEPRNFRGIVPRRSFSSSSFASSVANRQTEGEFSIPRKFRTKGQCTYVSSPSPSLPRAPLV